MPSQNTYRELTSTSNTTQFQARRLNIRERTEDGLRPVATLNGTLTMENSLISSACAADLQGSGTFTATEWYNAQSNSTSGTVDLGGPFGWANGSAINAMTPAIPSDSFFDQVDYIGAIKDATSDWTAGWTFTDYKD